jgi:hypothetical protein
MRDTMVFSANSGIKSREICMKTVVRAGILAFLVSLIAADAAWAAEK